MILYTPDIGVITNLFTGTVMDNIRYGNTKDVMSSNEKYLIELFSNKEELMNNGILEETINKFNIPMLKQFTRLLENEKRIRYRIDIEDPYIMERIDFATYELAGAGYFEHKNRISKQMPTIKCKKAL